MFALLFRFRGVLALLSLVTLSAWLESRPLEKRFAFAHGVQVTVLAPVQYVVNHFNRFRDVMAENGRLRTAYARLLVESQSLRETARENVRLREMVAFRVRPGFDLVAAEVAASRRDLLSTNLIIGAGKTKGVDRDMPVIALEGVVGKVIEPYLFHSNVQLITDANSRTGALFSRLNVPGILECHDNTTAQVRVFRHHELIPGDSVVTSGLGGVFPKGLFIGRVLRVLPGDNLTHIAEIALHPGMNNIEHVFVLRLSPRWSAFPEDSTWR